jgi:membrane protein implicated in regulation of membrane protease activity
METFFSPSVTYALFVLAGFAVLAEAGFTTFGVASLVAALLGAGVLGGIAADDLVWWPLLIAGLSIVAAAFPLAIHRRVRSLELTSTVLLAIGSILFAALNRDWPTAAVALAVVVGFYFGTAKLFQMVDAMYNQPARTGMESLVGQSAVVRKWSGVQGTVALNGAYWTCDGPPGLAPGQSVRVVSHDGMRLQIVYEG